MEGACEIGRLPEECVSHVLSLTSPRDSCRSALVSSAFRSAAGSDDVWERFLPSDHHHILSRAVDLPAHTSKKELYFRLCDSILIDSGRKSFALDKESGAKCFTLSARDLLIAWADHEQYWRWVSLPESRFAEVADLWDVCWLDINGKINSEELSPNTVYIAYLIFKLRPRSYGFKRPPLRPRSYGFKRPPQQVSVSIGAHISVHQVHLQPIKEEGDMVQGQNQSQLHQQETPPAQRVPRARSDGWMEIEMGEFFNKDGEDGEVSMSFRQVNSHWKCGLIVEGIQVRPK